jgi:cation diffusion facilitator family transporter
MEAAHEGKELSTMKLTVGLYLFAFGLKLAGFFITGVTAILADALHSLSDVFIYVFLLVATIWSRKEADEVHMFGHGRAQNVGALVAATLFISFTAFKLYEEAIPRLFHPEEAVYQNIPVALGVIGASLLIPIIPLVKLFAQKKRLGAAAKAQFIELFNDELSTIAALIGTLFIIWGMPLADPIAAVAVATLIAFNGIRLFKENLSFLLGRSPGPEFLSKVESTAYSVDGVLGIHDLRAEYIGPETVHLGMHIEVKPGTAIEEADRIAEEVRERIHGTVTGRYCIIHVDPAEANGTTKR